MPPLHDNPRMISSIFLATNLNFISTKTSINGISGFLGSPTAPLSSNLQGFTTKWEKITAFQDGHNSFSLLAKSEKKWLPSQAIFGHFSWCFRFFVFFPPVWYFPSTTDRSFCSQWSTWKQNQGFGLWHCEVYVKKRGPLQHSNQASTWYSVLLPASKDLKSSWSIAGVTSCYTAKYHLMRRSHVFQAKNVQPIS